MGFYNDDYNRQVASKVQQRAARNAIHIDRLNGAGATGMGANTKVRAADLYKQQNLVFENDIERNLVQPRGVVEERAKYDLGSGKYRGGSGMVGFPERAPMSAVEPSSEIRKRAGLDLGAGRAGAGRSGAGLLRAAGGAMLRQKFEAKEMGRGDVTKSLRGGLPHGMKKMAAQMSKMLLKRAKGRGLSGGAKYEIDLDKDEDSDEEDEDSEMEGGAMPLHMSGCGDMEMAERRVGGRQCCSRCKKCKCGSGMSGGYGPVAPTTESLYGYDNRAQSKGLRPPPSVNQQAGMCGSGASGGATLRSGRNTKPTCSFPAKMCRGNKKYGGAQQPVSVQQLGRTLLPQDQLPSGIGGGTTLKPNMMEIRKNLKGTFNKILPKYDTQEPASVTQGSKMQDMRYRRPEDMEASGRGNLDNYAASSSGSIIPELQSRKSNIGSGARASRGAMVSQLMREKGMSLGEASKYIKNHRMGSGVGNQ